MKRIITKKQSREFKGLRKEVLFFPVFVYLFQCRHVFDTTVTSLARGHLTTSRKKESVSRFLEGGVSPFIQFKTVGDSVGKTDSH